MAQEVQLIISAIDKTGEAIRGAEKKLGDFGKSVTDLGKKMTVGFTVPLAGMALGVKKFAEDAGKFQAVKDSFEVMSKGMITSTDNFLSGMKAATVGTLSNYEILTSANRALSLIGKESFGDFENDFAKMAEYVRKASRATGYEMDYLWDSVIMGVGRGSKMILDNLGITVDLTKAQEEWAKQLGKTSEELTDGERKTASLNHVLSLLDSKYGGITIGGANVNEKMAAMNAKFADLRAEIGANFIPIVEKVLETFDKFWQDVGPKVIEKVKEMAEWFANLSDSQQATILAITGLLAVLGPFLVILGQVISSMNILYGVFFVAQGGILAFTTLALLPLIPIIKELIKEWDFWGEAFRNEIESVKEKISLFVESLHYLDDVLKDWVNGFKKDFVDPIIDCVSEIMYQFIFAFDSIKRDVGKVFDWFGEKVDWFLGQWEKIKGKVQGIRETIFPPGPIEVPWTGIRAQEGGIVPGAIGQPVPALVHGGEMIIPPGKGFGNIYFDFRNAVITVDDLERRIIDAINRQSDLAKQGV